MTEIQIKEGKEKSFIDDLKRLYLQKNFGTFNKTELEELFVYLLLEYGNLAKMSNFERSVVLHLPESRVRSMLYRTELKYYPYSEESVRKAFFSILKEGNYEVMEVGTGSKDKPIYSVFITIEQQYLKVAVEALIKKAGRAVKGNFYKETLEISENALLSLFPHFFSEDEIATLNEVYKEKTKDISGNLFTKVSYYIAKEGVKAGLKTVAETIVNTKKMAVLATKIAAL